MWPTSQIFQIFPASRLAWLAPLREHHWPSNREDRRVSGGVLPPAPRSLKMASQQATVRVMIHRDTWSFHEIHIFLIYHHASIAKDRWSLRLTFWNLNHVLPHGTMGSPPEKTYPSNSWEIWSACQVVGNNMKTYPVRHWSQNHWDAPQTSSSKNNHPCIWDC